MRITVAQWLQQHPGHCLAVEEGISLEELLQQVNEHAAVQDIYVTDKAGCVIGHISKLRIAQLVLAPHRKTHSHRQLMELVSAGCAGELMGRHFPVAHLDEELDTVIHRQLEHRLHDMAVLDANRHLVGTISLTELLHSFT